MYSELDMHTFIDMSTTDNMSLWCME